jgi:cytochrome c oxidase subunit III
MAKPKPVQLAQEPVTTLGMHPKKFAMWLFIVSVVMLFAGLTSAYVVRRAEGNWLEFALPKVFYWSTAVILASSATMHWAVASARKDEIPRLKLAMLLTLGLGLVFLAMQWAGWADLVNAGVYFTGPTSNPSGSFLYVLSGLHGLHIISAVVFVAVITYVSFRLQVHSKAMVRIEMCANYWHFLDLLWVYLFVFLLMNGN